MSQPTFYNEAEFHTDRYGEPDYTTVPQNQNCENAWWPVSSPHLCRELTENRQKHSLFTLTTSPQPITTHPPLLLDHPLALVKKS